VTHNDPAAGYGYEPGPGESPFFRAHEAKMRTERRRDSEARHLADVVIDNPVNQESAAQYYRESVAADEYARAVYEVEAAKVRAR